MQCRNKIVSINKELAVNVLGRTWLVDEKKRVIVENLGRLVPSCHSGKAFTSLNAALAAHDYPVFNLPERIRIPSGTAIATPDQRSIKGTMTTLFTVDVIDFITTGIIVEQTQVKAVEYIRAPLCLADIADCVTSNIYIANETPSRIAIEHDENGFGCIKGSIQVFDGVRWVEYHGYEAFQTRQQAIQAADLFALHLLEIANWRRPTMKAA